MRKVMRERARADRRTLADMWVQIRFSICNWAIRKDCMGRERGVSHNLV